MGCRTSKFLCPDISFSFYCSIQMKPYLRRQAGRQFERRPYFLANSLSLCQMTDSLVSSTLIMIVLPRSTHLHCFSACSSWPTVWILTMVIIRPTLTNPFWPAATLSMFTLHLHIRHRNLTRVTGTSVDPTVTASATLNFLRTTDHSAIFFARTSPSCLILTFWRPSFADHPRTFFSSGDYSTALFGTTTTRFDLRETSVTTLYFLFGLFLSRPYSRLQI